MTTLYEVRLYNTSGELVAIFNDWRTLEITRKVSDIGYYTFSFGHNDKAELFDLDYLFEVRRKPDDGIWYTEFTGFHRTSQDELSETDTRIFTSYGRSLLDLIRRRCILYKANDAHTIKGAPGETVIKEFVNENAGPDATVAHGRLLGNDLVGADGVTPGLTIEADGAQGEYWAGQRAWKNLLDVIQDIGLATDIDFDVVRTTGANFEFQCKYPTWGTDRSDTVVFSTTFGNMVSPSYSYQRTEEVTRVAALGEGQSASRKVIVRESAAIADSPWNIIEATQDARAESTLANLRQEGDDALAEKKAEESFSFDVLQTYSLKYGRDDCQRDIVTARFYGIIRTMKITQVELRMDEEGKEEIKLEFTTV